MNGAARKNRLPVITNGEIVSTVTDPHRCMAVVIAGAFGHTHLDHINACLPAADLTFAWRDIRSGSGR